MILFSCFLDKFVVLFSSVLSFRNAYRAEIATFVVPVAGEQSSDARLRERIDFTSNLLFFIEDLFLAVGHGPITTKAGVKLNMSASLSWVRNQLAGSIKELMIAKKAGWKVLQNFKNQVIYFIYFLDFSLSFV